MAQVSWSTVVVWLIPLCFAGLLFGPGLVARLYGVRTIGPGTLEGLLKQGHKGLVLLDVRTDTEFRDGHIQKARHLPLDRLSEGLPLLEKLKDAEVVCVCASGRRSAVAAIRLKRAGFATVYNLQGGMLMWGKRNVTRG